MKGRTPPAISTLKYSHAVRCRARAGSKRYKPAILLLTVLPALNPEPGAISPSPHLALSPSRPLPISPSPHLALPPSRSLLISPSRPLPISPSPHLALPLSFSRFRFAKSRRGVYPAKSRTPQSPAFKYFHYICMSKKFVTWKLS